MLHILYLAHDLADPAVRRRVLMLREGGADVSLAGFRRDANVLASVEGIVPIELGTTADGRFGQRIAAVAKACLGLSERLGHLRRPDVIIARNLEMLAVANRAAPLFGAKVPIVYECLDIHRLLLRKDTAGKAIRAAEAYLGRDISALITSSPAFVDNYFKPLSGLTAPIILLENKVLELSEQGAPIAPGPRLPRDGEPWRIGWFGALRCSKSLKLLSDFSRAMQGRVKVELRGRPAYSEFDDFDGFVGNEPFMTYHGPYKNPEDLSRIYGEVQFSWAIDFFEEGLNSSWLLPNRLYEGCRYGAVPITLSGTETARFVERRMIGFRLAQANVEQLADLFETMTADRYLAASSAIMAQDPKVWICDRADCQALVQALAPLTSLPRTVQPVSVVSQPVAQKVDVHEG
ncbi:glycosyltransferase family 4 protein [Rhizobium sp. CG5]|uniref:glycosyltransferase n=1 Tax=Rhizobium sp. CG5 TaxID=2726076 RepID=UPI0020340D4E|nr:glycosyltransferase [Rhizobium sp. CG5]MCM2473491.1 glycosyltransferase family 4 protein [Rhizobium sp. CG5]